MTGVFAVAIKTYNSFRLGLSYRFFVIILATFGCMIWGTNVSYGKKFCSIVPLNVNLAKYCFSFSSSCCFWPSRWWMCHRHSSQDRFITWTDLQYLQSHTFMMCLSAALTRSVTRWLYYFRCLSIYNNQIVPNGIQDLPKYAIIIAKN